VHLTSRTYPGFSQWVVATFCVCVSTILSPRGGTLPIGPNTLLFNFIFFLYPLLLRALPAFFRLAPENWIAYVALSAVM